MTSKQQREYWLRFHRFQQRYEKMYLNKINAVLKSQVDTYIKNRDTIYIRSGEMHKVLLDLHQKTGSVWAWHTNRDLQRVRLKRMGQLGFSERMYQLIRQYFFADLLRIAEDITQTTIRLIQEVLTEAAREGQSFDEMVSRLQQADFTAKRARLIARTETVAAANQASILNAREQGIDCKKIWISARDNRTRIHHREVNQTVILLNEKFSVGGMLMDRPGDKAGGPSEVCNCRCVLGYIPIE